MWTKFFHEAYLILSVEINFSTVWLQDENNWKKTIPQNPTFSSDNIFGVQNEDFI